MECCHSDHRLSHCVACTPQLDLNLRSTITSVGALLTYLVSPEASNREHPRPAPLRPAWMGPLKGLLWAAVSIIAGTLLAVLCS